MAILYSTDAGLRGAFRISILLALIEAVASALKGERFIYAGLSGSLRLAMATDHSDPPVSEIENEISDRKKRDYFGN